MNNTPGDELREMEALGIGRALNHDWKRRNTLLGIEMVADPDDVTPFSDLDVVRLRRLINERFVPEWNGERTPATSEFAAFMSAWPEVTAHGYAPHPWRENHRMTIQGLECDLSRDALRSAFGIWANARRFVADATALFARWR